MLAANAWQMSYGERAALEGILAQTKPVLALEIGTAEGGSLRRIASHSEQVHSFDLVPPKADLAHLGNVIFHTGDSHELLHETLGQLTEAGTPVDFVLIDGDHSAEGVRGDIEDVLSSPAVTRTVIVLHDTMNPEVRRGIEAVDPAHHQKVALLELDLVPGYLARREPYRLQLWGGLGLIVVDAESRADSVPAVRDDRFHELFSLIRPTLEVMTELEARGILLDSLDAPAVEAKVREQIAGVSADGVRQAELLDAMRTSMSWRITAPLRKLKRRLGEQQQSR